MPKCSYCDRETLWECRVCNRPTCPREWDKTDGMIRIVCPECSPARVAPVAYVGGTRFVLRSEHRRIACGECPSCEEGHPERCRKVDP